MPIHSWTVGAGVATTVAFAGEERRSVNVSSGSGTVSPFTCTVTDFERSPGANESVPVAVV